MLFNILFNAQYIISYFDPCKASSNYNQVKLGEDCTLHIYITYDDDNLAAVVEVTSQYVVTHVHLGVRGTVY